MDTDRERLEELLAAEALDALDVAERAELDDALRADPSLARELDELSRAASILGMVVEPAPPAADVRRRVLSAAMAVRPEKSSFRGLRLLPRVLIGFAGLGAAAVAAILALAIVVSGRVGSLEDQVAALGTTASRQASVLEAVAGSRGRGFWFRGTENAPDAYGYLLVGADDRDGVLVVSGLPPLPSEQAFQLWLNRPDARLSGGVLKPDERGFGILHIRSPEPFESFRGFGLTIEPATGSPGPTGTRVLVGGY